MTKGCAEDECSDEPIIAFYPDFHPNVELPVCMKHLLSIILYEESRPEPFQGEWIVWSWREK